VGELTGIDFCWIKRVYWGNALEKRKKTNRIPIPFELKEGMGRDKKLFLLQ
jgi:hypothetical protein